MVEKNKFKSKYFNFFNIVLISLLMVCVLITGISVSALINRESEISKLGYQVGASTVGRVVRGEVYKNE